MEHCSQGKFNSLCSKYNIERDYNWLGSITKWDLLERALEQQRVLPLDLLDFHLLWSKHPKRNQSRTGKVNVLEYLSKYLKEATKHDVDLLYDEDRATYDRIESGEKISVNNLMARLRNKVRTRTRVFIYNSLGLHFVGAVPDASGQGGTLVQYVTYHTHTLVAKISDSTKLEKDVNSASRVFGQPPPEHRIGVSQVAGPLIQWPSQNIPTVMPILAVVIIPQTRKHTAMEAESANPNPKTKVGGTAGTCVDVGHDRMAIICPSYVLSVASLLPRERGMTLCGDVTIANVALCVLAAIKAFDQVGLIHGDIKPDNLMLNPCRSAEIVLIDFGSAVEHGEPLLQWSPPYPLGLTTTSVEYDLTCLAAVLFELGGGDLDDLTTVEDVIARSEDVRLVDKLVRTCLDSNIIGAGGIDAVWEACKTACEKKVGSRDGFTNVERIWPDYVLPDASRGQGF